MYRIQASRGARHADHGLPFLIQFPMCAAPVAWPVSLLEEAFGPGDGRGREREASP